MKTGCMIDSLRSVFKSDGSNKGIISFVVVVVCLLVLFASSCKKFVEVEAPKSSLTSDNIYVDDATAASVLTGVYAVLSERSPLMAQSTTSISLVTGLSADELTLHGGAANSNTALTQFYLYKLNSGSPSSPAQTIWSHIYSQIYVVNTAVERLERSGIETRDQLLGEAKFLRAFFYFYLSSLYGDVPLITSSDYRVSAKLGRTPKDEVIKQIINDLNESIDLLSSGYKAADARSSSLERLRPNKWAATALLARVYLYNGSWDEAERHSGNVISNQTQYDTVALKDVFLKNSKEAIWQLQPVNAGWNTEDAKVFLLPPGGPTSNYSIPSYPVYLSEELLAAFESGDKRKVDWIGTLSVGNIKYSYPAKYKSASLNAPITEYTTVLRVAEQYLIRSEARAHLGRIDEGLQDLNVVRRRAGLPNVTATNADLLLNFVLRERQVELFTEWGIRWLDLKRISNRDNIMMLIAAKKGTTWNPTWQLYPIPIYDILQNPNIVQNLGY